MVNDLAVQIKICEKCGLTYERKRMSNGVWEPTRSWNKRKFCSRVCSTGRHLLNNEHSLKTHPLILTWKSMKSRCNNPHNKSYKNYGARGIRVCLRWESFRLFLADVGEKPAPQYTLDRIDNDGDYEPSNCRWATRKEQRQNMRNSRPITYNGRTMTPSNWSKELGFKISTLMGRLNRGWTFERAINTPPRCLRNCHASGN